MVTTSREIADIVEKLLDDERRLHVTSNAFQLTGGWEGWLQVELVMDLKAEGIDVSREQKVYKSTGNKSRSDVKVLRSDGLFLSVELKAESSGQSAQIVRKVFHTDIHKVGHGFNEDIAEACGIIVLNSFKVIKEFDSRFIALSKGSMNRIPQQLGSKLKSGNAVYWWALDADPQSGEPIITSDSPEVFTWWKEYEDPDMIEEE